MSKFEFKKAVKSGSFLRFCIEGPSGGGKTYSALRIGELLAKWRDKPLACIDSERNSALKYADIFDFQHMGMDDYSPESYTGAIKAAEAAGFGVLVIDSLSHAWMGKGGALEQVDNIARRSQNSNKFNAWRDVTPKHNEMIDTILAARLDIIATLRVKTEYVIEEDARGKKVPKKVGMAPIQRDGVEYEFDVVGDITREQDLIIGKTRCPALTGQCFNKPGPDVAGILIDWLKGDPPPIVHQSAEQQRADETRSLLDDAEIVALFDRLKAPPAKREMTIEKYKDRDKIIEVLNQRLAEAEKSA